MAVVPALDQRPVSIVAVVIVTALLLGYHRGAKR